MAKITNTIDVVFSSDFQHFSNIQHWNGTPRNSPISLPHHSWWVTALTNLLCVELQMGDSFRLQAVNYAMFHDLDEMFTGDIMHPFKYNKLNGSDVRELIDNYVIEAATQSFQSGTEVGNHMIDLYDNVKSKQVKIKAMVKLADNLSLLNYCLTEVRSGNKFFDIHLEKCLSLIESSISNLLKFFPEKTNGILQIKNNIQRYV